MLTAVLRYSISIFKQHFNFQTAATIRVWILLLKKPNICAGPSAKGHYSLQPKSGRLTTRIKIDFGIIWRKFITRYDYAYAKVLLMTSIQAPQLKLPFACRQAFKKYTHKNMGKSNTAIGFSCTTHCKKHNVLTYDVVSMIYRVTR